jgi:hypothetical protein
MTKVMVGVLQQAVEKIDRTRAHAGRVFRSLLHRSVTSELYACNILAEKPETEESFVLCSNGLHHNK